MTTMCVSVVSSSTGASPASTPRGAALRVPGAGAAGGRRVGTLPAPPPAASYRVVTP